jgi:hypothetical protein
MGLFFDIFAGGPLTPPHSRREPAGEGDDDIVAYSAAFSRSHEILQI